MFLSFDICSILYAIICLKKWKKVSSCFLPFSVHEVFFPQCTMYQCPTTWLYMDIYRKTIKTRLRWIKENTLLNRQCNHTITSKNIEQQTVPLSTISPLDGSVGPCGALSWGLQSLVSLFRAADTMCTFVHLYQYVLGRNTIHRHSPNKTPEIL